MQTFKISELANEFNVTTRSIRFYEDKGLIHPERKGKIRLYQRRDKVRLKLILRGKRLGLSLAEIGELLELYDTNQGEVQLKKMLEVIDGKQALLQQQLDDINAVMAELDHARARCEQALGDSANTATT